MIKYTLFALLLTLRLFYQPSATATSPAAFAASPEPSPLPVLHKIPATVLEFKGTVKNNKVILNWVVDENETADLFEVEKSTDGVNFNLAALVFGTDKPAIDTYEFYEKAGNQKMMYRIKIVNKNKKAVYSAVVAINPAA
ncbi:MAG: hypothetical protein JNM19_10340 [Chitinophagaceae bacterium]|nr:hypothetical protein [Chitinophagaceae bacterium]